MAYSSILLTLREWIDKSELVKSHPNRPLIFSVKEELSID